MNSQDQEKCPECGGTGQVWTGGCSLEHGINTTCEEYGCLPRIEKSCSVCNGTWIKKETRQTQGRKGDECI
ncbi:MAG: hypothetical protein GY797_03315 [Deltaproteobacteria bacterium]|nr:hypothetical protein [Deltaproteobacteria bacterium]